jgi:hypothetical protein
VTARTTIESDFALGDRVTIDNDESLIATVTAFLLRTNICQIEVSWVHNGDMKTSWVDDWRLQVVARLKGLKP